MKKRTIGLLVIVSLVIAIGILFMHYNKPRHDSDFDKQWGLYNDGTQKGIDLDEDLCAISTFEPRIDIRYQEMWSLLNDKDPQREVVIAIIDTGIDFSSGDLHGVQWTNEAEVPNNGIDDDQNGYIDDVKGWNFLEGSDKIINPLNIVDDIHGTMCAGIIASKKNGTGIEGVTQGIGVRIMSLKVLTNEYTVGEGEISNVIKAIKYAEKMGAAVCNMSFNSPGFDAQLYDQMKKSSMLFVVSAGNAENIIRINIDKKQYSPACFSLPNQITVANIGFDGKPSPDTNIGPNSVDLAAPGTYIHSTSVRGEFQYASGTSYSAPFVTGVASMIYRYSRNPDADEIKKIICNSVTKLDSLKGRVRSGGILNAEKALKECTGNR